MAENADGKYLLNVLFNSGEFCYSSPDKYSSAWDEAMNDWRLYRPSTSVAEVPMDTTVLVGINPQYPNTPTRADENVSAYRSFLVECDSGPLNEQLEYIEAMKLNYSAVVFSGSKSLHFAVTLSHDLPTYDIYYFYAEWLLATLPKADQKTKNPSRAIRFPGVMRPEKNRMQTLLLDKGQGRISIEKFMAYLTRFPDCQPKVRVGEDFTPTTHNAKGMRPWVHIGLKKGFDFSIGRNQKWFAIGYEFGKCGYTIEECMAACSPQFTPDRDFRRREWEGALTSGHKRAIKEYWSKK